MSQDQLAKLTHLVLEIMNKNNRGVATVREYKGQSSLWNFIVYFGFHAGSFDFILPNDLNRETS